jgi:hypothetical protein
MKLTRRQLREIIREAQWGRFTGGAAPLDEPPLDSGPMTPEDQQRVFDMLVDSGSEPSDLKATGEYPDVDSLSSEVARRYFKRKYPETVDSHAGDQPAGTADEEALVLPDPYNQPRDAYHGDTATLTASQWIERQRRKLKK